MSPLEYMQLLAALVPRPRLYLIRFHDRLVPHPKLGSKTILKCDERLMGGYPLPGERA